MLKKLLDQVTKTMSHKGGSIQCSSMLHALSDDMLYFMLYLEILTTFSEPFEKFVSVYFYMFGQDSQLIVLFSLVSFFWLFFS